MLESIRVENFKAFQDTGTILLSPLTLLAGINSAGKSSIIQALLLLKQTLEYGTQALNPSRGPLLEQSLGDNFSDFIFGRPDAQEAVLTYCLDFVFGKENAEELFADLNALLPDSGSDEARQSIAAHVFLKFAWGPFGHRGRPTVRVAELQIRTVIDPGPKERLLPGLQILPTGGGAYTIQPIEPELDSTFVDLDYSQLHVSGLSGFLPDSIIIYSSTQRSFYRDIPPSFSRFFRGLFVSIRRDLSERIYYLSSFRDPPLRFYTSGQTTEGQVDSHGSNFPVVLWQLYKEAVHFEHPALRSKELELGEMLSFVLSEVLGLRQQVRVQPVGDREDIFEVTVSTLGPSPIDVGLADVGLGHNRVLPVVVQGLLAPPGAIVIFEQPEIHLHPSVQARLIDFFAGLARAGRQVLVETHSSHLVEHLCLAVVRDRADWLAQNTNVLFVKASKDTPSASLVPVQINSYGEVLNYPEGFLPDTAELYEDILKEGFAKKREQREGRA